MECIKSAIGGIITCGLNISKLLFEDQNWFFFQILLLYISDGVRTIYHITPAQWGNHQFIHYTSLIWEKDKKNVSRILRQIKFFCPIMHSLDIRHLSIKRLLKEYLKYIKVALTPSRCVMTQFFPFLNFTYLIFHYPAKVNWRREDCVIVIHKKAHNFLT